MTTEAQAPAAEPTQEPSAEPAAEPTMEDEVAEVFGYQQADEDPEPFDPFAPEPTPSVGSEAGEGGAENSNAPAPSEPAAEPTPPSSEPQTPAVPAQADPNASPLAQPTPSAQPAEPGKSEAQPADEKDLRIASLEATVQQLQAAQAAQPPVTETPKTPAAESAPAAEAQPEIPKYNVQLPPAAMNAILSDDPEQNAQGINGLMNGILATAHGIAEKIVETRIGAFKDELKTQRTQEQNVASEQEQAKQMQTQYFAAFPDHNKPVLSPILNQVAAQLATEFPNAPFDENYINALGSRMNAKLQELGASPTPAPTTPTPKTPAAMVPSGPRSESVKGSYNLQDDIQEVLGSGPMTF